jgi:dTDP-4-amino-4,6-dideoxygalactose transaminase
MQIPFVDLKVQYLSIKPDIDRAIQDVVAGSTFVGGEPVEQFEKSFADFVGVKHCIGCGNGTDSIEILLKAFGIGLGDEVIVPAISWISTSETVSSIGAKPVFVDIEEDYYTINPALIEAKITKKTKAIMPVHLYGQPANMPAIMEIAKKYNLVVIEDVAQAHGAKINGQQVGTFGDAASFSFYPSKNLGAYGDAGGMTTNNDQIAATARRIANHGQLQKHDHPIEGRNSRLDTLQAAILSVKLPYLKQWTHHRNRNGLLYNQLLATVEGVITPKIRENAYHVFHLYVIRTKDRATLQQHLQTNGIQTAIHYPTALPFLPCYAHKGYSAKDFPVAYQYQKEILSLPMYAELSTAQIKEIVKILYQNV